jgi:hypothetical protein
MTSELAKKIAERIGALDSEPSALDIIDMLLEGKFDDLLAPEGRPVLSDETIEDLYSGNAGDIDDHWGGGPTDPQSAYYEYCAGITERSDDRARNARIAEELRAWEAYVAKREVAG